MQAVTIPEFGGPEALVVTDEPTPEPGPDEVLIRVVTAGVNRADLLQRQGFYPPPPGESDIPGLEVSGVIEAVGPSVTEWLPGDHVCALLSGGGYAQYVAAPAGQVLPLPSGVAPADAAALPEVACTVWSNLVQVAGLHADEWLLVHGGSSGIGTMAIQVATSLGARVAVTAGSPDKLRACGDLGADVLIDYREEDFVQRVREVTNGHGVDVVLDIMGAKYLPRNITALAVGGRLVIIGMQGGVKGEMDIATLLGKRGAVHATSLRARPRAEKATIVAAVHEHVWPMIARGRVRPVIHARYPLTRAADAHRAMDAGGHIGKILLDVS